MIVKVVNDNVHPYTEKFKGNVISIPPKGHVEMDHNEAAQFLGSNPGIARTLGNGLQDPKTYKMLRIEPLGQKPAADAKTKEFVCMACNKDLVSKKALEEHIETEHVEAMVDEDAKEKVKRKPGRPKKEVTHDTSTDRNGGAA